MVDIPLKYSYGKILLSLEFNDDIFNSSLT